jgi:ferredoxin-NADP reductase
MVNSIFKWLSVLLLLELMKKKSISIPSGFYPCKIQSIKSIGSNYWQVSFYSDVNIWDDYFPGQFLTIYTQSGVIKCWIASHHYGADLPSVVIQKSIINEPKQGEDLLLSKPEGSFYLNPISNFKRSFLFIAQDEGCVPVYVMLQSLLFVENMSNAAIYTISKSNEGLFFDEIDFLRNMVHGRIRCELELNKTTVSLKNLNHLLEFTSKNNFPIVYVCGGKPLIDKVADFLIKKKIPLSNLQYFKIPLI